VTDISENAHRVAVHVLKRAGWASRNRWHSLLVCPHGTEDRDAGQL